ncbi:MAG: YgfZ/GcvT domain-containing protein [Acidobacteriota bacterium]
MVGEGSLAGEFLALQERVAWAPLVLPGPLHFTGKDARETLDRVVTQAVKTLEPGRGVLALLLGPKGQFRAIMAVFGSEDGLLLLAPPGRAAELEGFLGKYLAFSRSRLQPAGLNHGLLVAGPGWPDTARACGADPDRLAGGGWQAAGDPIVRWFGQTFLGLRGAIALAETDEALGPVRAAAAARDGIEISHAAMELARIGVGWPAWGRELTETVLPPEVGLERLAISYTKGCYVGQETIARMKTYGHPTRCLVRLSQTDGPPDVPELPLSLVLEGEEKRRGELTSFALHPTLGGVALALVRREGAEEGRIWRAAERRLVVLSDPGV